MFNSINKRIIQLRAIQIKQPAPPRELSSPSLAAIQREFVLQYQPRVNLVSRRTSTVEALVRWDHPECGILYPDSFIKHFESDGTIYELGEWILLEAVRQGALWANDGPRVSVNVSARQVQVSTFISTVERALSTFGLDASQLEIEVTESCVVTDVSSASQILNELQCLGVKIAIDDFGTGALPISALEWMPVNIIKVDQSIARSMMVKPQARKLAQAIITFAKSMGASTVIEGIETAEQLATAIALGVDEAQGFLFSASHPPAMLRADWGSHIAWSESGVPS